MSARHRPSLHEPLLVSSSVSPPRDVLTTFSTMHVRKLQRYLYGLALRRQANTAFWIAAYIGALIVGLAVGWTANADVALPFSATRLPRPSSADALLASALCAIMLGIAVPNMLQVDAVYRWAALWSYVLTLAIVLTRDFASDETLRAEAAAVFIGVELATFAAWGLLQHVLPAALLKVIVALDARLFWQAAPLLPPSQAEEAFTFVYHATIFGCCRWPGGAKRVCSYRGGVSSLTGRPHGYGEWVDDSFRGEKLRGYWEDGVPVAPFRSREFGSGHAFACVRIAYVATHADPFDKSAMTVRRLQPARALRCGLADVECAVSGQYFRHFPKATPGDETIAGPSSAAPAIAEALAAMRTMGEAAENEDVEAATGRRGGGRRGGGGGGSGGGGDGRGGGGGGPMEAVVYLPGFNTPLNLAVQRLGQLLALSNLPARFKPFVFSWPGGRALSYLSASRMAADPSMADDLIRMLRALRDNGVSKVHLLAHSMGARLVLDALPALHASGLATSGAPAALRIANLVLLSPDYPMDAFLHVALPSVVRLGCRCTIYGDRHDKPLSYSETLLWLLRSEGGWRSLGRLSGAPWAVALDAPSAQALDVIDTTWMQAGQPAGDPDIAINTVMRHSHFMINSLFVDDLVELLLTERPAEARTRQLRRRDGGVFHLDVGGTS